MPRGRGPGEADIIFLGQKLTDVAFVVADGDLYGAITKGGNMQNFGPAADIYDVSAILNPDTGLANILASFSDPKAEGREAISGSDAVKITGTVSAEAVNKIAPQLKQAAPAPPPRGSVRTATTSWPRCRSHRRRATPSP